MIKATPQSSRRPPRRPVPFRLCPAAPTAWDSSGRGDERTGTGVPREPDFVTTTARKTQRRHPHAESPTRLLAPTTTRRLPATTRTTVGARRHGCAGGQRGTAVSLGMPLKVGHPEWDHACAPGSRRCEHRSTSQGGARCRRPTPGATTVGEPDRRVRGRRAQVVHLGTSARTAASRDCGKAR